VASRCSIENVIQTSVSLQILVPLAFVSLAPAAVINLTAGVARTDDPVTGVNDWTLDAGYLVSGSNGVIFEAGGDDTGFGLTAADLAGLDESVDMAQFNNASFKPGGADILGSDSLAGNLYVSEAAPAAIPVPGSWGLVPEPSSAIL
jgi:hypothetical protein